MRWLPAARVRIGPSALLAFAGASLWISLGTLAVLDMSATRMGALPPVWLLALLIASGAAAGTAWRGPASALWPLALTVLVWLPWLPFSIPAAFLIWNGPAELFVWAAALGGVAAACAPTRLPARWLTDPRRAPFAAIVIGVLCAMVAAKALGNRIPAGDEPHYLIVTQSLLLDGDLQIENNHQRRDYLRYVAHLPSPDFLRRGVDGQIYSVHAPGLSGLVAPAFAIGGYPAAVIFIALMVAVGGALAWHAAWLVTGSAAAAWMGWCAVFFSAPVFFHAFTVYPDGAGAVMAMAAVWLLVRLDTHSHPSAHMSGALPESLGSTDRARIQRLSGRTCADGAVTRASSGVGRVARGVLVAVSAALAMLPWLHTRFAIVAAVLGLLVLLRLLARPMRWRQTATFLLVPTLAAVAWFAYFRVIYGTFSPAAPYGNVVQNRLATLQPGLPGLFFDQQFGLVANAPIFAVALIGLLSLARHRRRLAGELLLVAAPYVLAVASYVMWWAGHSAPARFLVVLLLPATLPVAWLFHKAAASWARAAIGAATLVGMLFVVLRTAANDGNLLYNSRNGYDVLLDWLSPAVNLPLAWPSFHRDAVALAMRDVLMWAITMSAALIALWLLTRSIDRARGLVWTFAGGILCGAVMIASSIAWMRHDTRAVTPETSTLAFLRAWNPAWHPVEVQLQPLALLTRADVLPRVRLQTPNRGPAPGANRQLLQMPLVPAGEYEIVVAGGTRMAGTLEVLVGASTQTIERFDLTNRPAGSTGLMLRLPVLVSSMTIRGDATATAIVSHVMLRPLRVRAPAERLTGSYAHRAARYGSTRVFFLDEDPFMEIPGFWTAGGSRTAVIVDPDEGAASPLVLRAGAAPTSVWLSSGAWRAARTLEAGQVESVELPTPAEARALSIETSASFRPADVNPSSTDLRALGVWVEFP